MIYLPILFGALTFGFFAVLGMWCERKFRTVYELDFTGLVVGLLLGFAVCCLSFEDIKDGQFDGRGPFMEAKK